MFFFFQQKTAYELRISDWSSDVCSSDLPFWLTGPGAFNPDTSGTLVALAARPTPDATDFEVWAGTPYQEAMNEPGAFSETAALTATVDESATLFPVTAGITAASVGELGLINDELVRVDTVGVSLGVSRGMLDTVEAEHGIGARLVMLEDNVE